MLVNKENPVWIKLDSHVNPPFTWKPIKANTTTLAYIEVAQFMRQTVTASLVESFFIGL